jgi:transcriptional regulator with XRE-family HTH domain
MTSIADNAGMATKPAVISERIREAIEMADVSRYQISISTGVDQAALSRFMSRERGLSMEAIDALAEYFGFELVVRKKSQRRKGR